MTKPIKREPEPELSDPPRVGRRLFAVRYNFHFETLATAHAPQSSFDSDRP